jgi:hypothetical protein
MTFFGEAALELPAHQRMQLGVLVDRPVDPHQQPGRLERGQVRLEIGRRAGDGCGCLGLVGLIEHGVWFQRGAISASS